MTATEILAIALLATWVLWGITLNANLTLRETIEGLRAADHSDCEAREAELIDVAAQWGGNVREAVA